MGAYMSGFLTLKPDGFADPETRAMLEEIVARYDAGEPAGSEGKVEAATRLMNDEAARELAEKIANRTTATCRSSGPGHLQAKPALDAGRYHALQDGARP